MPSLPRPTYDELSGALASELIATIEGFATRHDLTYDRVGFAAQSSCTESCMKELMGFGLDLWPAESDDPDGEEITIVPFPAYKAPPRPLAAMAAAVMVAMLGAGLFLSEPVNCDPRDMIQVASFQIDAG